MTTTINTGGQMEFIHNSNNPSPQFTKEESEEIDKIWKRAREREAKKLRIKEEIKINKVNDIEIESKRKEFLLWLFIMSLIGISLFIKFVILK
jgi:hypothetical protein